MLGALKPGGLFACSRFVLLKQKKSLFHKLFFFWRMCLASKFRPIQVLGMAIDRTECNQDGPK